FIRGVVGQEVAQVDRAKAGRRTRERRAPATGDADVLGAVLRRHAAPVEAVVERGDRLAQLGVAGHRRVLLIADGDRDVFDARGRAGQRAGLGLALAEVAPIWIAAAKAETRRLGRYIDDTGTRDGAECGSVRVVAHANCVVVYVAYEIPRWRTSRGDSDRGRRVPGGAADDHG